MAKVKVFITGATGFVGRHLMNSLPAPEFSLYGASFPLPPHPSEKNICLLDMRSERDVFDVIRLVQPQWIFHLAAVSNVKYSWERRRETMETNVMGTFYLFEAVRKFVPDAKILYVSSSDVYGFFPGGEDRGEKAFSEEDPFHLTNPYALSKMGGELLAGFYGRIENLDVIIARPFPHTGPGQSSDFVCSDWARQVIQIDRGAQEPVMRVGNLDVKRDFTDVRDTVRAYVLLMQKGRRGEVYNICRGEGVSLKEILDIFLSAASRPVAVEQDLEKMRKVDIPFLVGDNRKIRKETSWEPGVPLEKTLLDLLDYWRVNP
jgi:GDP-4-dehydro-6-deoxy-D-mannose reductase